MPLQGFLCISIYQGKTKQRSDCLGQVNFTLGQVKMDVWWSGGQVKLASVSSLVGDNFHCRRFVVPLKVLRGKTMTRDNLLF